MTVMATQIRPYVEGATGSGAVSFPKRDLSKEPPFGVWTVLSFAGRDAMGKAALHRPLPDCRHY